MMSWNPVLGSRAFWLRQMRQWHWISAAICLVGTLLFAITGITLNHASQIEARPVTQAATRTLPPALLAELKALPPKDKQHLPPAVADWIARETPAQAGGRETEWPAQEIYVSLPRPGGDAWLSIDLTGGEVRYERTDRGWISYLNDLHKGRHTGQAWSLFIDAFALVSVVFCVTGLLLLQMYANGRPSTWPVVAAGLAIPVLLALFLIH
jgi:hypothetical protein